MLVMDPDPNDPINRLDDSKLWQMWADGDETAFRRLLDRYSSLVWNVCRRVLLREQDAEDAFQITFMTLSRRGDQVHHERFGPWLYRVAYHASLQIFERNLNIQIHDRAMDEFDVGNTVFNDIERVERNLAIEESIDSLPKKLRDPLVMFHFEKRTRPEIAKAMGIPESKVKSRLQQARAKLRSQLLKRGLGAAAILWMVQGGSATAHAIPRQAVVETTLEQIFVNGSQSGLSATWEQVTILERKLMMHGKSLNLVKTTAVAFVMVALVSTISMLFYSNSNADDGKDGNGRRQSVVVAAPHQSINHDPSVQSSPQVGIYASVSPTAERRETRPTSVTSNSDFNAKSNSPSSSALEISGKWKDDSKTIDIDKENQLIRITGQVNFGENQSLNLSLVGNYTVLDDMFVGVIVGADIEASGSESMTAEEAVLIRTFAGSFGDQPFMFRCKATDRSLFVKDFRVAIPSIVGLNQELSGLQVYGMYISTWLVGEYESSN